MLLVVLLLLFTSSTSLARPETRTAPEECPLDNGNLLDVLLFVNTAVKCRDLCAQEEKCLFFHYYQGYDENRGQHSQCFLYDACSRRVQPAKENCPVNKENSVQVEAFIPSEEDCKKRCSTNSMCGYYLYYGDKGFCFHLKSCVPRIIQNVNCPLLKNNYIDHYLFTATIEDCKSKCEKNGECRYYYWYPIDYSPSPLYCYLFRSCEGGSQEHKVGFVTGGRHPGHYFLSQESSLDLVKSDITCNRVTNTTDVSRAAAVSDFVDGRVLLCGGRDLNDIVKQNCYQYDVQSKNWEKHSDLNFAREEAASTTMGMNIMYILGGIIDKQRASSIEKWEGTSWNEVGQLPEPRSRFCAVSLTSNGLIVILGGEITDDENQVSSDMKVMNSENGEWTSQPDMPIGRKDHACVIAEIDGDQGILVSGGVGVDKRLLDSVDFYSFSNESWKTLSKLQRGRTEHGMAVVGGLPTVMGGVAEDEFLSSIEVLDFSDDDSDSQVMGRSWRFAAHGLGSPRYDFGVAEVPISALLLEDQNMSTCNSDEGVVIEGVK